MDWKSSLGALRDTLPQGDDAVEGDVVPGEGVAGGDAAQTARLDVLLDRKGRKGKAATIVAGFTISDEAVAEIARRLKQRLGVGGSSRGGEILIQGDKRSEVAQALSEMGLKNRVI